MTTSKMTSPIKKTVSTETAKNGFIVRVEQSDNKGNWKTEVYIAKTKKEAADLTAKKI